MATYVLVPGGWAGGWQWRAVAAELRRAGHEVYTPTLTGLGERVHLGHPEVDLETNVQDIVNVLEFEDLRGVILLGYSYSGAVITGVADGLPERLAHLVYLDAFVPSDGQSLADLVGPQVTAFAVGQAQQVSDGWRLPHDPPDAPRRTPHPLKTLLQAVRLRNPAALELPRTFVYCPEGKTSDNLLLAPITAAAARAKADPRWNHLELPTGHLAWETLPTELARLLERIADLRPAWGRSRRLGDANEA